MISVLMTSYNGEKYIAQQIESILKQTEQDFVLFVSDDCSTDSTLNILESYKEKYPEKIVVIKNKSNSGSPKHNFFNMMIDIKDDYLMLCDQDDVWLPEKIEKTLKKVKEIEKKHGKDTPVLVHTDLCVVDENLNLINQSFMKAMNANYSRTKFNQIIIQNTLTGCTSMYNKALAELIYKEPKYCIMHDWWLILTAAAFGKIDHIEDQTILYRQHKNNEIGATDVRTLKYKIKRLLNYKEVKEALNNTYIQAGSFLKIYDKHLSDEQKKLLKTYISIPSMNKFKKIYTTIKLGVLKNGIIRKIANLIFI